MESKLSQLLSDLKRFGTINQEDIPALIKGIEELQASANLAWYQLELLEKQIGE
jgi:hypothetical protein